MARHALSSLLDKKFNSLNLQHIEHFEMLFQMKDIIKDS